MVRQYSDSDENEFVVCEDNLAGFPEAIQPTGLSLQRRWYLIDKICDFCPDDTKDLVCPKPQNPRQTATPLPPSTTDITSRPPPKSSIPSCGHCWQTGHNRRTCPSNVS